MRVALINNFPPTSGAGKYAYSLYFALKRKGNVQCEMFYMNPMKTEDLSNDMNKDVRFLNRFAYLRHPYLSRMLIYFINPLRIPKQYDVYHMTNHMLGRFAKFNSSSVVTVCDVIQLSDKVDLGGKLQSWFYNLLLRASIESVSRASRIICISEWTKSELMRSLGIDPRKIKVIYFGVDHDLFRPRNKEKCRIGVGLPLDKKIILNVGSEIPRKNVSMLIRAFHKLLGQNRDCVLVRIGEQTEGMKKLIEDYELEDRVVYLEDVSEERLGWFYNAADLFVFPSVKEGFGLPLLEAMACGCPTVAGNRSALPEVVGDAGVLVDPIDVDGLATCIEELLGDEERRKELSRKGIQRAADFSWAKCVTQTMEVYKEIVG